MKNTMNKEYYYDILDKLEEKGFTAEYMLNAFVQSLSSDELYNHLEYITRCHDIDFNEEGELIEEVKNTYYMLNLDSFNQPCGTISTIELTEEEYLKMKKNYIYIYDSYDSALQRALD